MTWVRNAAALAALLTLSLTTVLADRVAFTFSTALGAPPEGFAFAGSRQDGPGVWEIRSPASDRLLVHLGDPAVTMRGIAVATVNRPAPGDLKLTVRLRLVDGDRAGGLVWRYRDPGNFYFFALFLGDRRLVDVIRVNDGARILLGRFEDIELDAADWHTLTVTHEGDLIRAAVNGIGVIRLRDEALTEGRAGLFSAGNATTWFDDFSYEDVRE